MLAHHINEELTSSRTSHSDGVWPREIVHAQQQKARTEEAIRWSGESVAHHRDTTATPVRNPRPSERAQDVVLLLALLAGLGLGFLLQSGVSTDLKAASGGWVLAALLCCIPAAIVYAGMESSSVSDLTLALTTGGVYVGTLAAVGWVFDPSTGGSGWSWIGTTLTTLLVAGVLVGAALGTHLLARALRHRHALNQGTPLGAHASGLHRQLVDHHEAIASCLRETEGSDEASASSCQRDREDVLAALTTCERAAQHHLEASALARDSAEDEITASARNEADRAWDTLEANRDEVLAVIESAKQLRATLESIRAQRESQKAAIAAHEAREAARARDEEKLARLRTQEDTRVDLSRSRERLSDLATSRESTWVDLRERLDAPKS